VYAVDVQLVVETVFRMYGKS